MYAVHTYIDTDSWMYMCALEHTCMHTYVEIDINAYLPIHVHIYMETRAHVIQSDRCLPTNMDTYI